VASKREQQEALDRAVGFFEENQEFHTEFIKGVDARSDAYHAMKDVRKDPSYMGWRNAHFGPYVMHIVDSTLASMVEDRLRYKIRARPTLEDLYDPAYAERARQGERAHQILHDFQMRKTKFTRIQRPFLLQNAIAKLTVAKTTWVEKVERRRRMVAVDEILHDDNDYPILDPITGQPMTHTVMKMEQKPTVVYDGPLTEVVDVHDFGWPKNALSLESAHAVWHRTYLDREAFEEQFGDGGMFGPAKGGWSLKKVLATVGDSMSNPGDENRWSETGEPNHSWHKLEIIEVWDMRRREVVTFVNRCALLAHATTLPYFHEATPFTVCTTQPDLFSFAGISQVEKVMALQELLWKIQNQSVDNLELVNNAIVLFNPSLEGAADLPFFPGAAWPVEDPELVKMWSPNPLPAEISLNREALLKGDMQNLAATFPFSSGAESQTVDQKTATGASIVSSLAQRSIDMGKQGVYDAWEDIGNQRTILNGQLIREATLVDVVGIGGEITYEEIMPEILAGDYDYVQEPIPDAIMKQQEQAQASAMMQIFSQMAPILLPLAQSGAARMINFDAVIEHFLKANGIEDTDQFFIPQAPKAALPQQGSAPAAGGQAPMGITADGAVDPSVSPSAMISQSPETALQRAMALGGGGRSV
jgi:hypothetical protein